MSSVPDTPYVAPWQTGFRRYAVQLFPLGVAATPMPNVNFLGGFTQAQWPPVTAGQGDVALLADTYGGTTFAWPLEYRPDLSATKPWRAYGGDTASNATWAWVSLANNGNTTQNVGSFQVPLAGDYLFDIYVGGGSQNGGVGSDTNAARLGTTSTGTDIGTAGATGNRALGAQSLGNAYTATKGQTLYVSTTATANGDPSTAVIAIRPVRLANA